MMPGMNPRKMAQAMKKMGIAQEDIEANEVTFEAFPITPSAAPDANYEVANKKYVDDTIGGESDAAHLMIGAANAAYVNCPYADTAPRASIVVSIMVSCRWRSSAAMATAICSPRSASCIFTTATPSLMDNLAYSVRSMVSG